MISKHIPFEVEASRVIDLLARQIYQSPLALLRENVQNAFDAVRERMQRDTNFAPKIVVDVQRETISISDNGIGMSLDELRRHFWTAGSSSKNTPEARAAGVVGTFGIGAMANFGIASSLMVETESARTGERTISKARRDNLSLREDCVEVQELPTTGRPGTTITAELLNAGSVSVEQARQYVREFVRLVDVPIFVNDQLVSQATIDDVVPHFSAIYRDSAVDVQIGSQLRASCDLSISTNAIIRICLGNIIWNGNNILGYIAAVSGGGNIYTTRSGFGLAMAPISSAYSFGGIVDLQVLEPTAGREAITSEGIQLIQSMMAEIDVFVSERLSKIEQCNSSTPFMHWVNGHGRYDLSGKITIETSNQEDISLQDAVALSRQRSVRVYGGSDPTVIKTFSSEEATLLVLSRTSPRRQCQEGYIAQFSSIAAIPDKPTVVSIEEGLGLTGTKWGVAFRLESIITEDYFVDVNVAFGEISHGVSVLVDADGKDGKLRIILGSGSSNVSTLLQVYETHIEAFRSLAKDFARTVIFPRISNIVPSSTRQGAEAFIEAMRRKRETFEYDSEEQDELPSIWEDYREGRISLESAIDRSKYSVRTNVQYVDVALSVREIVPDLLENERALRSDRDQQPTQWSAEAPILRTATSSTAKLITIDANEPDLSGYRCFIALAPRAYADFGDFFTQPHSTSVVWGGQKALFIFIHHSGEFGIYYDMQTADFVGEHAGGGSTRSCTIVLKDKIYIPVPMAIQSSFIPDPGVRKRFEIKADLIRTGLSKSID
ncbi:MAG: ATP-binding protein [Mesorhizobium sp.]|uniref:ATP-binding protein n=1 Tax=Mesorhizobium sp. TaxID=1871066 RepID=UPI001220CE0A|nr:ATP-binding protein [Mesorhizobium sp.]TIT31929.1 MAG: ATP-binding protein [Mesorhizobium sp.]